MIRVFSKPHFTWNKLALLILFGALVFRLSLIEKTFFHPDEHAHLESVEEVVKAPIRSAWLNHPPFYFLSLSLWMKAGEGVIFARMLSLLFGLGALWVGFMWMRLCVGKPGALLGLGLLSFGLPMVSASVVVRDYSLFMLLLFATLYSAERYRRGLKRTHLFQYVFLLGLSLFTHYSGFISAAVVSFYVALSLYQKRVPKRVWTEWLLFNQIPVLFFLILLVYHLPIAFSWKAANPEIYYIGFGHVWESLQHAMLYSFGSRGGALLFLLIASLGYLIFISKSRRDRQIGLTVLFAIFMSAGLSYLRVYPLAGTRHSIHLLPFLLVAIVYPISTLLRHQPRGVGVGVCLFVLSFWWVSSSPSESFLFKDRERNTVQSALHHAMASADDSVAVVLSKPVAVSLAYTLGWGTPEYGKLQRFGSKYLFASRNFRPSLSEIDKFRSDTEKIASLRSVWLLGLGKGMDGMVKQLGEEPTSTQDFGAVRLQVVSMRGGERK